MLSRAATVSYQPLNAVHSAGIGVLSARVAKSTVASAVMSAAEKRSPATKGTSDTAQHPRRK